jgi:hypothetical protein
MIKFAEQVGLLCTLAMRCDTRGLHTAAQHILDSLMGTNMSRAVRGPAMVLLRHIKDNGMDTVTGLVLIKLATRELTKHLRAVFHVATAINTGISTVRGSGWQYNSVRRFVSRKHYSQRD